MSKPDLEEVLEEYAAATPAGNDLKILQSFIGKYPQFTVDLTDFAAARAVVRYAPDKEFSTEEAKRFGEAGIKNLHAVLYSLNAAAGAPQNAFRSLTEAAKAKGLSRSKLAAASGLSTSLVMYLEKRRLAFSTIPRTVVAKIAQVLETGEELVADYLNQPPDYAADTSFKTHTRAEEIPPKNFAEAVREDQQLTAEEKQKLLEMN